MTASLLDGKHVAEQLRATIKKTVVARVAEGHRPPGLAVICVGDDPASSIYVTNKRKMAADLGFESYAYDLPADTHEATLLALIDTLNDRADIDGILVQLPLPSQINTATVVERILPRKDVDGFHPYNLGSLAQGHPRLRPCTPYGVMQLLAYYQLPLAGKQAVVIGASNIVGRPMALELLLAKATVTICHRATTNLEHHVHHADLIVIATGTHDVIKTEWLQPKQIIVDVGIHRRADGSIHGDIDFLEAKKRVAWITPVPGGIGPMTVTTLLQNTLIASLGDA